MTVCCAICFEIRFLAYEWCWSVKQGGVCLHMSIPTKKKDDYVFCRGRCSVRILFFFFIWIKTKNRNSLREPGK